MKCYLSRLGCLLLKHNLINESVCIVLAIKLNLSGVLFFFRATEVSWKKFYLLKINVYDEIYLKHDYQ